MKTRRIILTLGVLLVAFIPFEINAQQDTIVEITDVVVAEEIPCQTHYYTNWRNNWYLQIGAGATVPFVENNLADVKAKRQFTLAMNFGVGHWFSPYMGIRFSALGGALHWQSGEFSKAKYANLNLDFMWNMLNTIGGVNEKRVVSIVPYLGLGGTLTWDIEGPGTNIYGESGLLKRSWSLPVSAGLQVKFRLCAYADFFLEGRAQFYGDNFNGNAYGRPIDVNTAMLGGFIINLGRPRNGKFNACDYLTYINMLNNQVNNMRMKLAECNNRLQSAESQLPCPKVEQPATIEEAAAPALLATVRFAIDSEEITNEEMVNVYNVAEWLRANPKAKISINGYADRETGTTEYNQALSKKRANAVFEVLVKEYGIESNRLKVNARGSEEQPYQKNNWNRIVIFTE